MHSFRHATNQIFTHLLLDEVNAILHRIPNKTLLEDRMPAKRWMSDWPPQSPVLSPIENV